MPLIPLLRQSAVVVLLAMLPQLSPGAAPKAETALSIDPLHRVEYTKPSKGDAEECTVEPENSGKVSSWVVKDPDGQVLRRFSDTNADKQVDVWCYFKDGLEVYRDIDTNYDRKADQHRWFNTGGSKWGVDEDQDERIDSWRQISPHEVAEELVDAIKNKDENAFVRLLLTSAEVNALRLEPAVRGQFLSQLREAPGKFRSLAAQQQVLNGSSRCVDFGASRPGALPSAPGAEGVEVVVYEGASALVETGGKSEQLQIGAMVQVGDAWRLVEAPQLGGDSVEVSGVFALSKFSSSGAASVAPPSEQMQALMAELEELDRRRAKLSPKEQAAMVPDREKKLLQLAEVTDDPALREQWYTQLADMYSSAAMEGFYPKGVKRLAELQAALAKRDATDELMAHVQYLRIWCDWVLRNQDPKQDFMKVQQDWLKQLRAFVRAYPNTPDAAEAYLQLGMTLEFAGEADEATEWYTKLSQDFSGTPRGEKGLGAVRRLESVGKPFSLQGPLLGGGSANINQLRGKHVLVQYWATWYDPSKTDMAVVNQAYSKYKAKGFEVLGVNLDTSRSAAEAYLSENRFPWRHVYDTDGLEGRLANEMGVMTLPLMILVDDQGKVVNRNLHASELDAELKRLLK